MVMIRKTTMTILLGIMVLGVITTTYAAPSLFGAVCSGQTTQFETKACEDLNNLNDRLTIQESQLLTMNTTLNDLTIRNNELTILHYPADVGISVPVIVPEIVPLPEYPTAGPTPEFAPGTPEISYMTEQATHIEVYWYLESEIIDDRYEEYTTRSVLETSTDGINWEIIHDITADGRTTDYEYVYGVEHYVEYLYQAYTYNDFANSTKSLIWSGILTEFDDNSNAINAYMSGKSVYFNWSNIDTFSHTPLYHIIERSTNYGEFEVIEAEYDPNISSYYDYDVISGNIYSYRVTMVTDFETQTRSGFASALVPKLGYVNVEPQIVHNDGDIVTVSGAFEFEGGTDMTYILMTIHEFDIIASGTIPLNDDGSFSFELIVDSRWWRYGDYTITLDAGSDSTLTSIISYPEP